MTLQLRADGLEWKQIDDEIVVLDVREASYLTVKGAGTLLWLMLVESTTEDELVGNVVAQYDVDEGQARDDVEAFLAMLSERRLLST